MPAIRDFGDRALLLECDSTDEVLAVAAALRGAALPGVRDIVPAARTVLVTLADPGLQRSTRAHLAEVDTRRPAPAPGTDRPELVIDVVYDGADLAEVAALLDMTVADLIAAHTGTPWQVAFGGFAPGFGYLVGGDPRLRVPRRAEPRTRVPAGSVALAGEFGGVYPRDSPGGWQLIGRTEAVLWDTGRTPPALINPGDRLRFRAVSG